MLYSIDKIAGCSGISFFLTSGCFSSPTSYYMKNQVVCGLIALFVTLGNNVFAQTTNFQFRRLDVKNGLSHNEATSFLKDRKGFLWIGTVYGLNRFDGYAIKQFLNRPNDPSSISDNI